MQTVSDDLAAALAGKHDACARLVLLSPARAVLATYEASSAILEEGSVVFDLSRVGRRSGTVTLANPDGALSPQDPDSALFPSALVRLERGAVLGGVASYMTLATLSVARFRAPMAGHLSLDLDDVLSALAQPFGETVTIADGTPAEDVIRDLWGPVLGATDDWELDGDGRSVATRSLFDEDDRLTAVAEVMAELGLEVFSDRRGIPVLRPIPDPTTADAVRAYRQEAGTAMMLDLERAGDRLPYNRVVVIAERLDGTVLRAVAEVTDPGSPLHHDRIGVRTAPIHRSAGIPDQASANAVARALLVEHALYQDAVGGTAFPDPLLDEGDVVTFREPVSGTNDRYRIDRVSHPVTAGGMDLAASKVLPVFSS